MFPGVRRENIGPLKPIGTFHAQVPILGGARSRNRHAPLALPPAERVLQVNGNFTAKLSVAEIVQFDRDSHPRNFIEDRVQLQLSARRGGLPMPNPTTGPSLQDS